MLITAGQKDDGSVGRDKDKDRIRGLLTVEAVEVVAGRDGGVLGLEHDGHAVVLQPARRVDSA